MIYDPADYGGFRLPSFSVEQLDVDVMLDLRNEFERALQHLMVGKRQVFRFEGTDKSEMGPRLELALANAIKYTQQLIGNVRISYFMLPNAEQRIKQTVNYLELEALGRLSDELGNLRMLPLQDRDVIALFNRTVNELKRRIRLIDWFTTSIDISERAAESSMCIIT